MTAPKKKIAIVLWIGFALCGALSFAEGKGEGQVTWMEIDFAPFYIHEGRERGEGIADRLTDLLEAELKDLEHHHRVSSPDRIQRSLELGEHVCSAAFLRNPEREKLMTFSVEALLLPPNGVTVLRDAMPFQGQERVSMEVLLQDPTLQLGLAKGRAYGEKIDEILLYHRGENVVRREGEDIYAGLLRMLLRGRVDWILGYPYESVFVAEKLGVAPAIRNLALDESPDYVFAHVVCPKTRWGESLIERIDAVLLEHRKTPEHRSYVERWLDDGTARAYREAYEAAFDRLHGGTAGGP